MIIFVSDLWYICGILKVHLIFVLWFPPAIKIDPKNITEILLKVAPRQMFIIEKNQDEPLNKM
jgi:hypothetical protein